MKLLLLTLLILTLIGCDTSNKDTILLCHSIDSSQCQSGGVKEGNWLAVFPSQSGSLLCKNMAISLCYEAHVKGQEFMYSCIHNELGSLATYHCKKDRYGISNNLGYMEYKY